MLVDVRTYTVKPGMLGQHLKLYRELGKGPQTRHLGEPLAFLTTETGDINQYIHMWVYEDAADRERRRKAMWDDPEWKAYAAKSTELGALLSQTNRLMKPAEFFPLKR